MQPKKIITLLLVVVLTFICGVTSVAAQNNAAETLDIAVEATSSTAILTEPVSVSAGATVDVSVAIKANPGVTVVNLALNYDVKALTPKTDADGNLVVKLNNFLPVEKIVSFDAENGVIEYQGGSEDWTNPNAQNVTATGALFTVTFTVKEAFHGETALTLSEYETGIINNKWQVLSANVFDGKTEGYNKATVSTHKWGTPTVVEADCITDGTTTHTCTDTTCKKTVVILDQPALRHDLTEPATCTTPQTCKRCGYVAQEATNHKDSIVVDAGKDATCTEKGLTEGSHCSVCGTVIVAQEEIALKDHDYSDWIVEKEATKKEEGLKAKTCNLCGDKVTEVIPVLPSSNTWLIVLIIVLAVVVLGAGGFCLYWFVLRKKNS